MAETCNNNDDDCDGTPDDIAPEPCQLSTDGIDTTCLGLTACTDGALVCTGRAPSAEICDGVDNDCDDTLDDSISNCLDTGCVRIDGTPSYIENGAPSCFEGGCVYANPNPCGYFTCAGGGAEGDACATACTDDTRCIDNATCVGGTCQCRTGYAGVACQLCAEGYQDNNGDGTCVPGCPLTPCDAVGGACDDTSGTATCTCNEGWAGEACDTCDQPDYTDPDRTGLCTRRGEVDPGPAPGEVARVGKVWRFAMTPSQTGWMPGDAFDFTLEAGPVTMAIDPATGEIAWTPAPEDQTWNADPTLSTRTTVTVRATAPDGQFAEHTVQLQVLPAVFVTGVHPAAGLSTGGEPLLVFGAGFVEPDCITGSIGAGFSGLAAADLDVHFLTGPGPTDRARGTVTAINAAGTELSVTVPSGARTGPVTLSAPGRHTTTSHVPVVVSGTEPVPFIFDATPEVLAPGEVLVIRGQGFNEGRVTIGGLEARVLSEEPHRLVVEVPDAAFGPGALAVEMADLTIAGPTLGISGRVFERIAGGAPTPDEVPSADPFGGPVTPNSLVHHPSGLILFSDGLFVRALNRTGAAITAFGRTAAPGTVVDLTDRASPSRGNAPFALAVRPRDGDLFFIGGHRVFRIRQSDGLVETYAGQRASGNTGNDGPRLDATFNAPRSMGFTSDGVLVLHDTFNGPLRAINTGSATTTRWGITLPPNIVKEVEPFGPNSTVGLAIDRDDAIYVPSFSQLFRIAPDRLPPTDPNHVGRVRVAGAGGSSAPTTGCPALSQVLGTNHYATLDPATGDLYLGSRHAVIRRIVASGGSDPERVDGNDCVENYAGLVPNAAGVPQPGASGDGGPALLARIDLSSQPTIGLGGGLGGELFLTGPSNELRRVTRSDDPDARIIETIAGKLPDALDGLEALDLRGGTLHFAPPAVFDAARDRWLFVVRSTQVIAVDRATGDITTVAGTGRIGNQLGTGGDALATDFGDIRGMALRDGRHLVLIETLLPRVSSVDLVTGKVTVLAGDGLASTSTEDLFVGPAAEARVNVTTNRPRVTIGPDGLIYFANSNLVRVINPTDAEVTTFGLTIPPGHIQHLPTALGANVSRVVFDRQGNLWVASNSQNRLSVLRTSAPTTPERVIGPDAESYGRFPSGRLGDLRANGIIDMHALPNGDLLLLPQNGHLLYHVKADADGHIDADSPFVVVLGTGPGGGGSLAGRRPVSAQSLTTSAIERDDVGLLISLSGTAAVRLHVDF